jgi:hypothetical protein
VRLGWSNEGDETKIHEDLVVHRRDVGSIEEQAKVVDDGRFNEAKGDPEERQYGQRRSGPALPSGALTHRVKLPTRRSVRRQERG